MYLAKHSDPNNKVSFKSLTELPTLINPPALIITPQTPSHTHVHTNVWCCPRRRARPPSSLLFSFEPLSEVTSRTPCPRPWTARWSEPALHAKDLAPIDKYNICCGASSFGAASFVTRSQPDSWKYNCCYGNVCDADVTVLVLFSLMSGLLFGLLR